MSKVYKLVESEITLGDSSSSQNWEIDWTKCIICQEESNESLRCPTGSSNTSTAGAGYKSFAENLQNFNKIGALPKSLKVFRLLKEGQDIEISLRNNEAKWHDSCRLKYNKTKLNRALKRKAPEEESSSVPEKFTRKSKETVASLNVNQCFFCDKPEANEGSTLHSISTFEIDTRVRQCAYQLQDQKLLVKLSGGDLIAQEAKYHLSCLVSLYNKARNLKGDAEEENSDAVNHGLAFAGLVSYIEESRLDDAIAPVFKLSDLLSMYKARLEQLGTITTGRIHSTRLKERILSYFPDLHSIKQGREVLLVFNEDVGNALGKACEYDADNDAVYLARAATIVRKEMFKSKNSFNGSFDTECQENSVPASLLALVSMVINGTNIKTLTNDTPKVQSALTISQLLMYNSSIRRRKKDKDKTVNSPSVNVKHSQERETPLPIYLGLMVHTKTRKRELVDTLFSLGLSISYDRVLELSTDLGNEVIRFYESEKAVCPPKLRGKLFTTAAVDNIDHNPSSTSSHDSFHGTGISLFQHADNNFSGILRDIPVSSDSSSKSKKIGNLPESYMTVEPVVLSRNDAAVPKLDGSNKSDCQLITPALKKEYRYILFIMI